MTGTPQAPQPGWYPDQHATGGERWWDGQKWTDQRRPAAQYASSTTSTAEPLLLSSDAGRWGLLWAIVLPIVGLVYGLVLMPKQPARATQIILVSVVAAVVYAVLWVTTRS